MTSSLVTWVNEWFYHPGTPQTPQNDRMSCYEATVVLIGGFIHGSTSFGVQRNIHDLLTYLLLGWNPITSWPKESEFDKPDISFEVFDVIRDLQKRLLDFQNKNSGGCTFPLLDCLDRVCHQYGSTSVHLYTGERLTMLMLSLWLLKRNTELPKYDLGLVRNLLDLSYRSESVGMFDVDIEYARSNHDLHYCDWIRRLIDRLLRINVPTKELINSVAYAGWYMSLVRASRMLKTQSRSVQWKEEIENLLNGEIEMLKSVLYHADLKCSEDQIQDGSSLRNSARLFRLFKKKPPPVKLLPVEPR